MPWFSIAVYIAMDVDTGGASTSPIFDSHIMGSPLEYCHNVWYGKTKMVGLPDGEKGFRICFSFPQLTWTWWTDRPLGIGCAYAQHHAAKILKYIGYRFRTHFNCSTPDPAGADYDAPPDSLVGWGRDTPPQTPPRGASIIVPSASTWSLVLSYQHD